MFLLQLYVTARDSSPTPRSTTATMIVTVVRNSAPFFTSTDLFNRPVGDQSPVGSTIVTVTAVDNDAPVSTFPGWSSSFAL